MLPAVAVSTAATALSAPTAAATAPAISATTAAARSTGAGARLVNLDSAPLQIGVIESLDCLGRIGRFRHLDEAETARLSREFVGDDHRALDFSRLRKQVRQVILSNRVGKVAYIQLSGHKAAPPEICREAP